MCAYEVTVRTDVGRMRGHNEDALLTMQWQLVGERGGAPILLAAVADGMGGHSNGHLASKLVLRTLAATVAQGLAHAPLEGAEALDDHQVVSLLRDAVGAAARKMQEAEQHGLVDMGTTLCATLLVEQRAFIANLGDSRAYLYDGTLQQLTTDHSMVAELVNRGELTPAEARVHPRRNEIYRMLGFGRQADPDLFTLELEPGDILLLCSDGLNTMVENETIRAALQSESQLEAAAQRLVDLANEAGGEDNISLALIRVEGGL